MVLDMHTHLYGGLDTPDIEGTKERMAKAGISGGAIISLGPKAHANSSFKNEDRLKHVVEWCKDEDNFYPVYWIDPIEEDAEAQVEMAAEAGVVGFKIICGNHYPGDPRAIPVYERMAKVKKPVLFHSGILWDGKSSSKYNRPAEFEDLLDISGLKFAMAHISWPWTDECIAVYGKFQNAYEVRGDETAHLYLDTTPGTPGIYREDMLRKLYTVGYDLEDNIMFGTDRSVTNYDVEEVKWVLNYDKGVHSILGNLDDVTDKYFYKNFLNFWDI